MFINPFLKEIIDTYLDQNVFIITTWLRIANIKDCLGDNLSANTKLGLSRPFPGLLKREGERIL